MPQELQVLRCCECESFQGHIVKKDKKWVCKICNQKQTTQMVYGRGSGKECRLIVQELNMRRLQLTEETPIQNFQLSDCPDDDNHLRTEGSPRVSRWKEFLEFDDCNDNGADVSSYPSEFSNRSSNCNKTLQYIMEDEVVPDARTSKLENRKICLEHFHGGSPSRLDKSVTNDDDGRELSKEVCQDYICVSLNTRETVIINHPNECQTTTSKRIINRFDNKNGKRIKFDDLKCSARSTKENIDYGNKSVALEDNENNGVDTFQQHDNINDTILEENEKESHKFEKIKEVSSFFESEHYNVDDLYNF